MVRHFDPLVRHIANPARTEQSAVAQLAELKLVIYEFLIGLLISRV
jgi:hypothetical protein